jgi:hypothetical protein
MERLHRPAPHACECLFDAQATGSRLPGHNRPMRKSYRSLVGGVFVALSAMAVMQPATALGLADAIHACTHEPDDARRLACYDAAAGHTGASAAAVSSSPTQPRAAAKSSEISATITQLSRHADGRYAVTLSNGEIWQEVETRERFQAHIGDVVTLRTEVLGARYLHMPGGTDVRVSPVTSKTKVAVAALPTKAAPASASTPASTPASASASASALAPVAAPQSPLSATPAKTTAPSTDIAATITHLTRKADGRFVITLSNGEVWLQAETKERFLANVGDVISLRTQLLGAHYLRTPKGSDVRVLLQP